MTVRVRFVGAFVLLSFILFGVASFFAPNRMEHQYDKRMRASGTSALIVLSAHVEHAVAAKEVAAVRGAADNALGVPDVSYVEVLGGDGEVMASAGERPPAIGHLPPAGHADYADDEHIVLQQDIVTDERVGVLRVAMSRAGFADELANLRMVLLAVFSVIALASSLTALILSRLVVRPIEQITRGVRDLDAGRIERIEVARLGGDEVHTLAEAINRLRADLSESNEETAQAAKRARVRADKLERANVELDRFAYVASHDLRAPLRGIATLSEFIQEDLEGVPELPAEVRSNLEILQNRVTRLDHLLMSLLEYSRAGRSGVQSEEVDVRALVEGVVDLLAVPEGFDVQILGTLPTFTTARAPLERVFIHLIGNAIKHHDLGEGHIEVSCEVGADTLTIKVSDDGPGIPAELQDKAFKIFSTLKRRDEVEGSGMGLALIQKIVETAGGQLALESEGRGCTFIVEWPLEWLDDEALA